jgi:hypothetical protein
MGVTSRRTFVQTLVGAVVMAGSVATDSRRAVAAEVGQAAPDFRLPSTTGVDVSLGDFRGKKWVLLEFYGHDFVPT